MLDACPNLRNLARDGDIRQWRDPLATAELARSMVGICPSAWREACEAMGEVQAAITLAAILQRADQINSAGGYLRSLTDKAREGKFSILPMIMALLRAKLDEKNQNSRRGADEVGPASRNDAAGSGRDGAVQGPNQFLRSFNDRKWT